MAVNTENRSSVQPSPIEPIQIQPKDSGCWKTACRVGKCVKTCFLDYFKGWKDIFLSVRKAWWVDGKVTAVLKGFAAGSLALAHIVGIAAIIAGCVLLATGTGGIVYLCIGIIVLPTAILSYSFSHGTLST